MSLPKDVTYHVMQIAGEMGPGDIVAEIEMRRPWGQVLARTAQLIFEKEGSWILRFFRHDLFRPVQYELRPTDKALTELNKELYTKHFLEKNE